MTQTNQFGLDDMLMFILLIALCSFGVKQQSWLYHFCALHFSQLSLEVEVILFKLNSEYPFNFIEMSGSKRNEKVISNSLFEKILIAK